MCTTWLIRFLSMIRKWLEKNKLLKWRTHFLFSSFWFLGSFYCFFKIIICSLFMYTRFLKRFLALDVHWFKVGRSSKKPLVFFSPCFCSGKTTRTPTRTATTHSRRPWTETSRWWAARTRTKPRSELQITRRLAQRCCSLPPPASSLYTAWLLRRRPAQYQCQAPWLYQAWTHCTTNTTTMACMTPYWTLWPPTWSI